MSAHPARGPCGALSTIPGWFSAGAGLARPLLSSRAPPLRLHPEESMFALLCASAFAGDIVSGTLFSTEFRTEAGYMNPGVLVGFNPQPDPPGIQFDGKYAVSSVKFDRELDVGVVIGVGDPVYDVATIEVVDERGGATLVWGKGAEDKFFPPGPCFDLRVTFEKGAEMTLHIDIDTSEGGYVDPGSLVGFNPQPEPPGDRDPGEAVGFNPQPDPPGNPAYVQIDLSAYARGGATLDVGLSLEANGETLPMK
jgi:hypothetical protein